jgi:hypothetical protein
VLADHVSWLEGLSILGPGIIGITLARRPHGLVMQASDLLAGRGAQSIAASLPTRVEELGITVPFEARHRVAIDQELAIDA